MIFAWLEVNDSSQTTVEVDGRALIGIVQKVSLLDPPYTVAIGEKHIGVFTGIDRYESRDQAKDKVESVLRVMTARIRKDTKSNAGVA